MSTKTTPKTMDVQKLKAEITRLRKVANTMPPDSMRAALLDRANKLEISIKGKL